MANTTIVSNPYNFNIISNTAFSATIDAVLPSTPIELFYKYVNLGEEDSLDYAFTITIPHGVKVVELIVETSSYNDAYSEVYNTKNSVNWVDYAVNETVYIGVSQGKTYNLSFYAWNIAESSTHVIRIKYSSEINAHAVDVEDY